MKCRARKFVVTSALAVMSAAGMTGAALAGGSDEAVPLKVLAPRYPAAASEAKQEGSVCFALQLTADGKVSDLRVTDSTPKGVFDEEASRVLKKWTFKPVMKGGQAVAADNVKYCLDFKLDKAGIS